MESSAFKIEGVSSNKYTINDIPIAAGVPTNGSILTYDSTKNQWVITPHEYIHVARDYTQVLSTTVTLPISYNTIIKDKTQTNIKYNITDSTWTLQPGTYRFSVYFPVVYMVPLSAGSSNRSVSAYVSYTSIATGDQTDLKASGALWRENDIQTLGSFIYNSLNSMTAFIVTEPVIAHITFAVEIGPAPSEIYIGNAQTETGFPSVLVEQIE